MAELSIPLTSARPERFVQGQLPFRIDPALAQGVPLEALDLFAGIGGLSIGFRECGFAMTGVDSEPIAKSVYEATGIGVGVTLDLGIEEHSCRVPVVLGGPPCRPWAIVNQKRRRGAHDDHFLFDRFIDNVLAIAPAIALMENVPALAADPIYAEGVARLRGAGYSVERSILQYSDFGAPTRRKRLFTVAIRGSQVGARRFFELLDNERKPARTVRDAIFWLRTMDRDAVCDHDWSELRSIDNYRHLYESGKYGWAKLRYDEASPSFGSVSKTYILHPEAGDPGFPERVVSVREVLSIMGFDASTAFPTGTPRAKRYQMAANAVAPQVSRAVARVIKCLLIGDVTPATPNTVGAAVLGDSR